MNDRDCENCKHHKESCESWDCEFEPCEPVRNPDQLDCISRQAVLKLLDFYDGQNQRHFTVENLKDEVENMPSVNPQKPICPSAGIDCEDCPAYEPKTGHWIDHEKHIECDSCSVWFLRDHLIRKSFCPACGAKMVEPQEGGGEE